eukprot:m.92035 g.92035  ORF g.92035 m.92035 type:complete len:821 (-) comp13332_c0_seq3:1182-3644(-)
MLRHTSALTKVSQSTTTETTFKSFESDLSNSFDVFEKTSYLSREPSRLRMRWINGINEEYATDVAQARGSIATIDEEGYHSIDCYNEEEVEEQKRKDRELHSRLSRNFSANSCSVLERLWALLRMHNFQVARSLVASIQDTETAKTLIIVLDSCGDPVSFLQAIVRAEVESTDSSRMIFRRNSGRCRLMSMYMRLVCHDMLAQVLAPVMQQVTSMAPMELNPVKQPGFKDAQLQSAGTALEKLCQDIFDRLAEYRDFRFGMRTIASIIYSEVEEKFPGCGQDALVTVIFLRLVCPAIVSPWVFGLTDQAPHPLHLRSLVLISKLIQMTCAASGGSDREDRSLTIMKRENYMKQCKGFVDINRDLIVSFCLDLGRAAPEGPQKHIQLNYPTPPALWTCSNKRCRYLNFHTLSACEKCESVGGPEHPKPVDRNVLAVSLVKHSISESKRILSFIRENDASEVTVEFEPYEILQGAIEDYRLAAKETNDISELENVVDALEMELFADGSSVNPLISLVVRMSVKEINSRGADLIMLCCANGLGAQLLGSLGTELSSLGAQLDYPADDLAPCWGYFETLKYYGQLTLQQFLSDTIRSGVNQHLNGVYRIGKGGSISTGSAMADRLTAFMEYITNEIILSQTSSYAPLDSMIQCLFKSSDEAGPNDGVTTVQYCLSDLISGMVHKEIKLLSKDATLLADMTSAFLLSVLGSIDAIKAEKRLPVYLKTLCQGLKSKVVMSILQKVECADFARAGIAEKKVVGSLLAKQGTSWETHRFQIIESLAPLLVLHSDKLVPGRTEKRRETLPYLLSDRFITTMSSILCHFG